MWSKGHGNERDMKADEGGLKVILDVGTFQHDIKPVNINNV